VVMINFAVDPVVLEPLVPNGTILDSWNGLTFVSLVGFLFANTRVLGIPIPGHRTFEEVNLRFYVRRPVGAEMRRGVTFIRELVPRRAIAAIARVMYNEPYRALPMRHQFGSTRVDGAPERVEYGWQVEGEWSSLHVVPTGRGDRPARESQEEFITEHYWGYTRQRDGTTVEYRVEHPPWRVWQVEGTTIAGNLDAVYGNNFAGILRERPASAFMAEGSAVTVMTPRRLELSESASSRQAPIISGAT